jgi:transcriptional regulator with XRE-family HTH domain
MTIVDRLQVLMRWRGIKSQNQLARISGVAQSSINRIFTQGERYLPRRDTLLRLARALDTTPYWLTDGVEIPRRPASHAPEERPPPPAPDQGEILELQSLATRLSPKERRIILALLRRLVPKKPKAASTLPQ